MCAKDVGSILIENAATRIAAKWHMDRILALLL